MVFEGPTKKGQQAMFIIPILKVDGMRKKQRQTWHLNGFTCSNTRKKPR